MLCHVCQLIFQGELDKGTWRSTSPHHETHDSLLNSIQNGCYICARIWHYAEGKDNNETSFLLRLRDWQAENEGPVTEYDLMFGFFGELYLIIRFCGFEDAKASSFLANKLDGTDRHVLIHVNATRFIADHVVILDVKHAMGDHEVAPSTSSLSCLDLAYRWFKECTSSHSICGQNLNDDSIGLKFIPTRLLDIQIPCADGSPHCRLIETSEAGVQEPYATLSHRWGTKPIKRLEKSTVREMKSGIDISELPQTFQDAITTARHLHIRYLWIDSLCIVQDSHEDWSREASTMKDVYANSACTITSTWGNNSYAGCFVERDPRIIKPCTITTSWNNPPDLVGTGDHPRVVLDGNEWEWQVKKGAVNRRGWVLQERLLSPRVLHFGETQLFWECRTCVASEGLPGLHESDLSLGENPYDSFKEHVLANPNQHMYERWQKIVTRYMACDLTRPEDKLVAISGIAKAFQGVEKDGYLAGLWREDLSRFLLWRVAECKQANGRPSDKPPTYRAPSWSWASIDAEIEWLDPELEVQHLISIQEATTQLVTDDPMGQIREGLIKLRGILFEAEFRKHDSQAASGTIRIGAIYDSISIYHDLPSPDTNNHWCHAYFLPVCSEQSMQGLLVRPVDSAKTKFERCGYFSFWHGYWPTPLETLGFRTVGEGGREGSLRTLEFLNSDVLQDITLI